MQVPQRQVGEVVTALVGTGDVRGERGVGDDPVHRPAARLQLVQLRLGVMQHLRLLRVGQPRRQGPVVLRGELGDLHVGRRLPRRERHALGVAGAPGPLPDDLDARAHPRLGLPGEPAAEFTGGEHVTVEVEALLRLRLRGLQREQALTHLHAELQAVEDGVHLVAVPGAPGQVVHPQRQVDVADQLVEPPVGQHLPQVGAQRLPRLALDRVGARDEPGEVAELPQPFRRGLRPDPGHAGQVVGGLADEGGEVAVALREHAVLGLDRLRGHPRDLRDPAHRVQQGGLRPDELEGVAVSGDDEHLHAGGDGLRGERGDDVVGLVAGDRDVRDA